MKNEVTAKRLRLALDNSGMKSQELAEKAQVSKSSISQYVNGSHAPSNISAGKIGKVLGVDPLWLMGFDVSMKIDTSSPELTSDILVEIYNSELAKDEQFKKIMKYYKSMNQSDRDMLENIARRCAETKDD
jgi:transcriptional regulator with XRE-family HTH domain|nr:MAG TPA: helix-turn-helix domain protein [Bacteriophage sp.]